MRTTLIVVLLSLTVSSTAQELHPPAESIVVLVEPNQVFFSTGGGSVPSPNGLVRSGAFTMLTLDTAANSVLEIDLRSRSVDSRTLRGSNTLFGFTSFPVRWYGSVIVSGGGGNVLSTYDAVAGSPLFEYTRDALWGSSRDVTRRTGNRGDFIVVHDTLFFRDGSSNVRAISHEGEILDHETALELMDTVAGDPEDTYRTLHPVVAERNRALRETGQHYVIGGRYYSTEFVEKKAYLDSIIEARDWEPQEGVREYSQVRANLPLVGYDDDGNSYWGSSSSVRVLSPTGQTLGRYYLLDLMMERLDQWGNPTLSVTGWSIDPDGTAWAIGFHTTERGYEQALYLFRFDPISS